MFISFFFAALGNFSPTSDPFRLIQAGEELYSQPDGRGLNPLLQHWAMIIHPPILYFGYISFAIPFAIAMAALAYGQVNLQWTMLARRWTLFSWFFLGTGMLLGGKWAYEELGWGGYWAWDPVENASLMPWLTGTAFLHSIVVQERRGYVKGMEYGFGKPILYYDYLWYFSNQIGYSELCSFFCQQQPGAVLCRLYGFNCHFIFWSYYKTVTSSKTRPTFSFVS